MDLAINPRGRDREIHDRIFSLTPGQFGGVVSWLADDGPDAEHTDGIAANEAVRLLERFKRNGQAFFLGVGFYRPHTPHVALKALLRSLPAEGDRATGAVRRRSLAHSHGGLCEQAQRSGTR